VIDRGMDERRRIEMLARLLAAEAEDVELGIGDDAAVLAMGSEKLVWTIDEQVEGVHFRRGWLGWSDVGWRSTMAAASDLAAMGALAWCGLASIVLPEDVDDRALEAIGRGQQEASKQLGAPIVGGNLSRGPAFCVSTTFLGRCARPILRSGARAGDGVWLSGRVGLAAAGLKALEQGRADDARLAEAVAVWRRPHARVSDGRTMALVAHAAIDVSDGLARDAGHIADASGVCIVLDEGTLLDERGLRESADALGASAVELALHGGEDYALVAASDVPIPGFRRIGEMRAGRGIILRTASSERAVEPLGFDHFG
jgi:thiamine-monophosphate kinase